MKKNLKRILGLGLTGWIYFKVFTLAVYPLKIANNPLQDNEFQFKKSIDFSISNYQINYTKKDNLELYFHARDFAYSLMHADSI